MKTVAVLDTNRTILAPTTPCRARLLLSSGKAAVFRRYPFTIILKHEVTDPVLPELKLKIDPGSKVTGIAIVDQKTGEVNFAAEIEHYGQAIKSSLESRRSLRRGRRTRKTRYRQPRFNNRIRAKGWLPPSLNSRIENTVTWVGRLNRVYPISGIAMELVRFDMQKMENPEIEGVEYQQGQLAGFEVKEYLLIRFNHKCAYARSGSPCDQALEVEHINPKSKGGSNRISNLTIACHKHNQEKGAMTAVEYGFPHVQAQAKKPLKDAAAVNASRWALLERLRSTGLPVETGSGGLTKFNRVKRDLRKEHWVDAACVGKSTPEKIVIEGMKPLRAKSMGHGSRQICRTDKYGFPKSYKTRNKTFMGFQTGDIVSVDAPNGKAAGRYIGRVTIRQRPSFIVNRKDVHAKYLKRIHRSDGYSYEN